MEILSSFGIHLSSLIAQIINFGILVFVLTKLVYKPLIASLEKRADAVKKLESNTKNAEKVLEEALRKQSEIINESRKKAEEYLNEAKKSAEKLKESIVADAKNQAEKVIADGRNKIEAEQKALYANLKSELADLMATGIEKTVGKYIDKNSLKSLKDEAVEVALKNRK